MKNLIQHFEQISTIKAKMRNKKNSMDLRRLEEWKKYINFKKEHQALQEENKGTKL